jgi:hypothetical protein
MLTHLSSGNLVRLAQGGGWEAHAAAALLGLGYAAFAPLADVPGSVPTFYLAVGHWMQGDESRAIALLERLPELECASRLLSLICRSRIEILSFLPESRRQPHMLADADKFDSKFKLRNISFGAEDVPNRPNADIHQFYDRAAVPDFLICEMVEWHVLPRNLQEFPAPLIGHTSDFDLYPQTLLPYLRLFDVMLSLGDTEWHGTQKLLPPERCIVFPDMVSVENTSQLNDAARLIDFVQTNTVFSPIHRDKESVLKRVLDTPGLKYFLHNGALNAVAYQRLLQQSKLTLSFIRNAESIPSRAMEALAAGACCLLPKESVLHLYVPPGHGLLIADPADTAGIQRGVLAITRLEEERYRLEACRGARLVREHFSAGRVGSRYLRFCTVMAALATRAPRTEVPTAQSRHVVAIGYLPAGGRADVIDAMRVSNELLIAAKENPTYRRLNERARNAVMDYNLAARMTRKPLDDRLLRQALADFSEAMADAPDALAPAFNFVRVAFHFGTPNDKVKAETVAREILAVPIGSWRLDFEDDLLPYDFMASFANTRALVGLLLAWAQGSPTARGDIVRVVLAGVHFYLGWRTGNAESFRHSILLDDNFVEARLAYCHALLGSEHAADAAIAAVEMEALATQYAATGEVGYLLARARRAIGVPSASPLELSAVDMTADYYNDFPALAKAERRFFADSDCQIFRRASGRPEISLIVADRHLNWSAALRTLVEQRSAKSAMEVVHVERFAAVGDVALGWADVAVQDLAAPGIVTHFGRSFTQGFLEASGDILFFAEGLNGASPEALSQVSCYLKQASEDAAAGLIVVYACRAAGTSEPAMQWIALRRRDFLTLGGFDNSFICQGFRGGIRELLWRAGNREMRLVDLVDGTIAPASWLSDLPLCDNDVTRTAIGVIADQNWQDPNRTTPLWPAPSVKAMAVALGIG